MGLESATFINQLVTSNPTGSDGKSQGDDHLRLIKQVLQNSFPNITGAVTMTQAQLNTLGQPGVLAQPGMVTMWWGSPDFIPSGWKLCNGVGTISNGSNVPDLRDRFVVGAGAAYALGAVGGAITHIHGATTSVADTTLTLAQIPSHTHTRAGWNGNYTGPGYPGFNGSGSSVSQVPTDPAGGGGPHNHGATTTISASDNRPPYIALYYIIKN